VAVARSSSECNAICYVLPVMCVTSFFSYNGMIGPESKSMRMFRSVCTVAAPGANSAVSDCILFNNVLLLLADCLLIMSLWSYLLLLSFFSLLHEFLHSSCSLQFGKWVA